MTEEEYFRKYYPDSCYGDKPLSPYWDFFQEGVEFGERESEEKIADLEEERNDYRDKYETVKNESEVKIAELTEQNTSLLTSVENLNKSVQELQHKVDTLQGFLDRDVEFDNYQKENAELKILVSSMLYEINALWDISEMNEDVRKHAERIDSEVEK